MKFKLSRALWKGVKTAAVAVAGIAAPALFDAALKLDPGVLAAWFAAKVPAAAWAAPIVAAAVTVARNAIKHKRAE